MRSTFFISESKNMKKTLNFIGFTIICVGLSISTEQINAMLIQYAIILFGFLIIKANNATN